MTETPTEYLGGQVMSMRLVKLVAPAILFFAAGPASAQHHGGGGHGGGHSGGHVGGVHIGGGGYHSGYRGGYSGGYRGGYYGGYRNNYYGYGGGFGYPFLGGYGYGLGGYGSGYGLSGYGYGYSSPYYSGYSSPYYSGYSYPYTGAGYYPSSAPALIGNGVVQASGVDSFIPPTATTSDVAAPATVTVVVPDGAQVWFDGKEATTTGSSRVFTSPTLQPGQSSVLSVKARWDGSDREMRLPIQAGDKMTVDLRRD